MFFTFYIIFASVYYFKNQATIFFKMKQTVFFSTFFDNFAAIRGATKWTGQFSIPVP